ncbi:hypothetical protein B5K08_34040 [Rhizobium leguminosarum bv. trifolii]|uniref:SDR family oxidoreductase n=1 Tax=Rhizobium leguminosarum TaxID=384 RepID=UPI000E30F41A|nr:SDR family oxidoreductase [Rhizobium leguminosarum]RFB81932.1 hypothetical protein B5K08_34040 [Rhizobium leguminosarum bv. trifolii]
MNERILVTGATGNIGREVVRELQQRNANFAVMTSHSGRTLPGVSSGEGDFADPASLERAFRGFDTAFLLFPMAPNQVEMAHNAVQAAKAAGIRHIVRSSSIGADPDSRIAIAKVQGEIDELVKNSGLPWTLLRPSFFMQNWATYHAAQLKSGTYYAAQGEGAMGAIDVRDIAESAVTVLRDPATHAGRIYTLTGGEALTNAQQLAAISDVLGSCINYVDVPEAAARDALLGMGMPEVVAGWYMDLNYVVKQGWGAEVTSDVKTLTGHAPRTFQNFVKEYADSWR